MGSISPREANDDDSDNDEELAKNETKSANESTRRSVRLSSIFPPYVGSIPDEIGESRKESRASHISTDSWGCEHPSSLPVFNAHTIMPMM